MDFGEYPKIPQCSIGRFTQMHFLRRQVLNAMISFVHLSQAGFTVPALPLNIGIELFLWPPAPGWPLISSMELSRLRALAVLSVPGFRAVTPSTPGMMTEPAIGGEGVDKSRAKLVEVS